MSPSRSALRRTRSAWASSMLDEWVFTPMPNESQTSSTSVSVIPSSLESSWTRTFFGKRSVFLWVAELLGDGME